MYKPIESYGVIGDLHSVALVGNDGSIDWCCLPHFDSASLFAAVLDDRRGGFFRIAAVHAQRNKQMYLPDTNVLVTRFLSAEGVGEVVDFMPVQEDPTAKRHEIVRVAKAVRGTMRFRLECRPAFDYARRGHHIIVQPTGVVFDAGDHQVALISRFPLHIDGDGAVVEFTLGQDESATFLLRQIEGSSQAELLETRQAGEQLLVDTVAYWNRWLAGCRYQGRWREMVHRSALVLKLLTFQPTGAIVAAPTTSLPEEIGGVRNWDYRYTWIRDAAFTLLAFMRLGFVDEAAAFMGWLERRAEDRATGDPPLQLMYRIDGGSDLHEQELGHLDGYRGSRPVRVGNGAAGQLQLDIYGELLDALHLYDEFGSRIGYDLWLHVRRMLDWVCDHWELADEGIWEVRGGAQQFTYSKLQCWVALDRGLRLAAKRSLPLDTARVAAERDRIYETIMTRGYDSTKRSFVQSFGSEALDASNLTMPLVQLCSPTDPRMLATLDRTAEELVSDSLVYRYEIGRGAGDGLTGSEGTFNICTFWLVEALAGAGRLTEARLLFEKMLTYANHVGLYAEETGPLGEALGNFPQAFTHLGLISAAYALDRALDA